jgi:hypothetical protein
VRLLGDSSFASSSKSSSAVHLVGCIAADY